MPKSSVYGPVASWRLGRSLGVDMLCTEKKTCNYDCIYCQLGKTEVPVTTRQEFVSVQKLNEDLQAFKDVAADWVTFCGMGEPTLAANLGEAILTARFILKLPIAVFTNASLIKDEGVRQDLFKADMVIAKLDAAEDNLFKKINQPPEGTSIGLIIQGLQMFRFENPGKVALDLMLNEFNRDSIYNLVYMTKLIGAAEVHLNTPIRPNNCKPLTPPELETIRKDWFWDAKKVRTVYKDPRPDIKPIDELETELRHPSKPKPVELPSPSLVRTSDNTSKEKLEEINSNICSMRGI